MEKAEGGLPQHHSGQFFAFKKPGLSPAELGMDLHIWSTFKENTW